MDVEQGGETNAPAGAAQPTHAGKDGATRSHVEQPAMRASTKAQITALTKRNIKVHLRTNAFPCCPCGLVNACVLHVCCPIFFVAIITPVIHYCMGGLEVTVDAEVVSKKGVIGGLYAAGEIAGGVHGNNRLGGNSLLDCVVFGRVAEIGRAHV